MIKSLRLLNWRSHSDTKLEFRQGTNLLVGIMGAGKSSVLEAVSFALYGTFPAVERRKLKLENVVRLSEPQAKVILEFQWDNDLYRVERTIERSKRGTSSGAELFRNGSLLEHGQTAVSGHIVSLVGADYDLFTRAIYSEQNNIDHFLNLDPKKRKEEIDSLLGLDRFELARANSVTVLNRLRSRRSDLEGRFSRPRLAELEAKEKSVSASEASLRERLVSLSGSLEALDKEYHSLSAVFSDMKKAKEASEKLEKECIRLLATAESLSKELEGRAPDEARRAEIGKMLSAITEERSKFQTELQAAEAKLSLVSKETGSIDHRIKTALENALRAQSLRKELSLLSEGKPPEELLELQRSYEKEALAAESELHSLRKQVEDVSLLLPRLSGGLSKCPLCSAPLDQGGINHVRGEKESAIRSANARIGELKGSLEASKKNATTLSERVRKSHLLLEKITLLEKDSGIDELQRRKAELEQSASELDASKKTAKSSLEKAAADSESLRLEEAKLKETAAKHAQLAEARKTLEQARDNLAQVHFIEEEFEKCRTALETIRIGKEKALSESGSITAQIKLSGETLAAIRGELASLGRMDSDIRETCSLEEQLALYRQALSETQAGLRGEMSEAINSAMNEIWSLFYPYRNYHGLRLLVSEKDYVFEVNDGASWKSMESVASGGERACAALALRMSLAMVLTPRISWLILDEPTHNLDSEAIEMLSHALQFKVPQVVKQTFVITHDEAFMGSDFASSFRLSRDKDRNGHTKAEQT